ncbi:hypothetical protein LSH36_658g01037 [Paralvinella palmiformis]|uniref:Uncharacterized protein n=1 Tax=Paralvinella palmiformis TaxID=53620 RepID=A0AAD9J456_9ANNE|nr:hypothetical protein LSH36_658g01037 [Paralvinella palmiformis]
MTSFAELLAAKKYAATDTKQIRITSTLINFVAETLQPVSVVEAPSFTKMFHAVDPRYQLPSRKHLTTTLITNKTTRSQIKMREELSKVANVCVTIDLWTSRQMRSYLGITGHYVQDYRLVSAIQRIQHDKSLLLAWIVAAPEPTVVDLETDYESDNDVETDASSPESSENVFGFLPEHQPCFVHTLQLCVNDGMKDAGYLQKAANVTRWNSEVKMIRSILNIPKEKLDQLDTLIITESTSRGGLRSVTLKDFLSTTCRVEMQVLDLSGPWVHSFYTSLESEISHADAISEIRGVLQGLRERISDPMSIFRMKAYFFGRELNSSDITLIALRELPSEDEIQIELFTQMMKAILQSTVQVQELF